MTHAERSAVPDASSASSTGRMGSSVGSAPSRPRPPPPVSSRNATTAPYSTSASPGAAGGQGVAGGPAAISVARETARGLGLIAAAQLWPEIHQTAWPFLAELARAIGWQALLIGLLWREVVHEARSRRGVAVLLGVGGLLWLVAVLKGLQDCGGQLVGGL